KFRETFSPLARTGSTWGPISRLNNWSFPGNTRDALSGFAGALGAASAGAVAAGEGNTSTGVCSVTILLVVTAALALANWAESESGGWGGVLAQPAANNARKRAESRNV